MLWKARMGIRSYLSTWFLRSAMRWADQAIEVESEHAGDWKDPWVAQHTDLVLSSFVNAIAFFDAMINELYTDAFDGHGLDADGYLAPLTHDATRLMAVYWGEGANQRSRALVRYRMASAFTGTVPIESDEQLHENVVLATRMRNALVHYTPRTVYADDVHNLEAALRPKYSDNALMPEDSGNPWWPNRALSGSGATWAVQSVTAYADEFSARLGIVPNYQRHLFGKPPPERPPD